MSNLREELNGDPLWGLPNHISEELLNAHDITVVRWLGNWLFMIIMCSGFIAGIWVWKYLSRITEQNALANATKLNALMFDGYNGFGLVVALFVWICLSSGISMMLVRFVPMPFKGALFFGVFLENDKKAEKHLHKISDLMKRPDRPQDAKELINHLTEVSYKKNFKIFLPIAFLTALFSLYETNIYSLYSETGVFRKGYITQDTRSWLDVNSVELGCNHVTGKNASDDLVYKISFSDGKSIRIEDAKPLSGTWIDQAVKIDAQLVKNGVKFGRWKWKQRNPLHPKCLNVQRNRYAKNDLGKISELIRIGEFSRDIESISELVAVSAIFKKTENYERASELLHKALDKSETKVESQTPETAYILDRLGSISYKQKDYMKSRDYHERALKIRKVTIGENAPQTATSMNNLALAYKKIGNFNKSEALYLQALKVEGVANNDNYRAIVIRLNNLASLYREQIKYSKAEQIYLRALDIRERKLGEDHPSTASSLNSLGYLYKLQGNYVKSEPLYLRALDIRERSLGTEHRLTAESLTNLGLLYEAKGQHSEAEILLIQALDIKKTTVGNDHTSTASTLNALGRSYVFQGKYSLAEPVLLRGLEIQETMREEDHPRIAASLNILGKLYTLQGNFEKAEPHLLRALEIRKAKLAPNHPFLTNTLKNIAEHYDIQGRASEAEYYLNQIRPIEE